MLLLTSRSRDRTGLIMLLDLFLVRFLPLIFVFVPCGGLSWLHVSFLLHVKYTISYHIGVTSQNETNQVPFSSSQLGHY